jgi:ribose/xylose/arabinose/galactoside ABC-type transport system permease subunit
VAARAEIHRLLRELAARKVAILIAAGDAGELQALCERVLVLHRGRVAAELPAAEASEEAILRYASGLGQVPGVPAVGAAGGGRTASPGRAASREATLAAFLLVLAAVVGAVNPRFLSAANLCDLGSNAAYVLVAALGMTAVIVSGNIDISVGSALGLTAALAASLAVGGWGLPAVLGLTMLAGASLGLINAVAVTALRLPAIIVTLGTLNVFRGLLIRCTHGRWITGLPASFRVLALGQVGRVPIPVLVALAAALAMWVVLRFTAWGRCVYLWGDNAGAARRWGVPGTRTLLKVFLLMGALNGLAAALYAARFSAVQSNAGLGFEMLVITAVVVGGTNIFGGRGTVLGTVLGVVLVTVLSNALTLLHLSAYWDRAAQGALVLAAVAGDALRQRRTLP